MSHTYSNLLTHLVFSTHDRRPCITGEMRPRLFEYMSGIARELRTTVLAAGGIADHVHMLIVTPPSLSIADALQEIKGGSSKWLHETFGPVFDWQRGYGAFSVSRSNVPSVVRYIERQEAHHRKRDFKQEFLELLRRNGVEIDERYLWK
ncbi:MAG TPA: IS200/IS605 family transposase [Thermoanaerobaculia bacterium]|nr:IS200/IS605 family transposase [Thermoanaerobaculia bacterium]